VLRCPLNCRFLKLGHTGNEAGHLLYLTFRQRNKTSSASLKDDSSCAVRSSRNGELESKVLFERRVAAATENLDMTKLQ